MQDLIYGIWKNDKAKRIAIWEDVMKETLVFFKQMTELGYEDRIGQQDMSYDIIESIRDNQDIIVEASVGIGKSYAYLIPLMYYYKITKKPFIVSTSTITLQEQIQKDIVKLSEMLEIPIDITIAKGKNNYLCKERLFHIRDKAIKERFNNLKENEGLNDRANLQDMPEEIWNKININECKFQKCSSYYTCNFIKKREKMKESKGAIICNHDLLLENQKRKINEQKLLLSATEIIVLDEAHNLEIKARNSYKKVLTFSNVSSIINKSYRLLSKVGYPIYSSEISELNEKIKEFFGMVKQQAEKQINILIKKNIILNKEDMETCDIEFTESIVNTSKKIYEKLEKYSSSVQLYDRRNNEDSVADSLLEIIQFYKELSNGKDSSVVFWIEKSKKNYLMASCPKNINEKLRNILFNDKETVKILTSATLNTSIDKNEYYDYFMKTIGLSKSQKLFISEPKESPFDIENNTLLYYSNDIAHPQKEHNKYIEDITNRIVDLISITEGKTLILFTAKADMKIVYDKLKNKKLPYKLIIQNEGSSQIKTKEDFKEDINSVLLSTGTFWEGIDIQGNSLSSVIIVRLPFPILDPVIKYKSSLVKDPMSVYLPEMIIKLKQGVGRLIRCNTDKGIIAILDSRIGDSSKSSYKEQVFDCIKSVNKTTDLECVKKFVKEKEII